MTEQQKPLNHPLWQSEEKYPQICQELREGLRDVKDPELGMDIIQLGLIRDVLIEEDNVQIRMILTTPFCPYGPQLIEQTQQRAQQVVKRNTIVNLDIEPWDFSMMEDSEAAEWGLF